MLSRVQVRTTPLSMASGVALASGSKDSVWRRPKREWWNPRAENLGDTSECSRSRPLTIGARLHSTIRSAAMTKSTTQNGKKNTGAAKTVDVLPRAAELSDEVLESVKSGQQAAIEGRAQVVDTVDEALSRGRSPATLRRSSTAPLNWRTACHDAVRLLTPASCAARTGP